MTDQIKSELQGIADYLETRFGLKRMDIGLGYVNYTPLLTATNIDSVRGMEILNEAKLVAKEYNKKVCFHGFDYGVLCFTVED